MNEAILLAYLKGHLSETENEKVDDWVAQSTENYKRLEQIYYTTFVADRLNAYETANVEAALNKFRSQIQSTPANKTPQSPKTLYYFKKYSGLAAAFLTGLILSAGVILALLGKSSTYQVSTLEGQRAHVTLPDGSHVWLNASTNLAYQSGILNKERKISFDGEAYFEVKKNKHKPFVVVSEGVRTEVLGTKFNVRSRSHEKKVVTTLFDGAVQMFTHHLDKNGKRLKPGETMEVDLKTYQSHLFSYNTPKDVLLWIKGDLKFNHSTLSDMTEKFEKVYNVRFIFKDDTLKNERFTCEFKTDYSLNDILTTLSLTQHFNYNIDTKEGKVYIYPVQ